MDELTDRQRAIIVYTHDFLRYYTLIQQGAWKVADKGYSMYNMKKSVEGCLLNAQKELSSNMFEELLCEARLVVGELRFFPPASER